MTNAEGIVQVKLTDPVWMTWPPGKTGTSYTPTMVNIGDMIGMGMDASCRPFIRNLSAERRAQIDAIVRRMMGMGAYRWCGPAYWRLVADGQLSPWWLWAHVAAEWEAGE